MPDYYGLDSDGDVSDEVETRMLNFNMSDEDLVRAHMHCTKHSDEIQASSLCGCFSCLKVFSPLDIESWFEAEGTALCPYCSVDAVIGDKSGYPITNTFLAEMRKKWFAVSD